MKKTLLTILATACAFSASAESSKEGKFYVTGALGGILQNKISNLPTDDFTTYLGSTYQRKYPSAKPNIALETGIGAGYYVLDNFRIEALYIRPFLNKSTFNITNTSNDSKLRDRYNAQFYVNSLQIRSYVDLVDISGVGKLYASGGLGLSHIKGKITQRTYKFKSRFNFAYALGVGAGFDVSDNINLGVEYNFSHHGKAKLKQNDDWKNYKTNVRGHSLLAKLRFDI